MKFLKLLVLITLLSFSGTEGSCLSICGKCSPCFKLGADWLYWTPCISDQHFTLSATENQVETHYLCSEWKSGVRVFMKSEDVGNGFGGSLTYSYIRPEASGSISPALQNSVAFSNALPVDRDTGDSARGNWKAEYQSADLLIHYDIKVACSQCFNIQLFTGLTWVDVEQNRTDILYKNLNTSEEEVDTFYRHQEFWAVGPAVGLHSSIKICNCFDLFGTLKVNAVIGKSESIDRYKEELQGEEDVENVYFANDSCSCFPGFHLITGVDYDFCYSDADVGIRLGWEYVQWVNAPTFPSYEQGESGIRSATNNRTFSMQGIFVGLYASF